jgi:hypothetical protein
MYNARACCQICPRIPERVSTSSLFVRYSVYWKSWDRQSSQTSHPQKEGGREGRRHVSERQEDDTNIGNSMGVLRNACSCRVPKCCATLFPTTINTFVSLGHVTIPCVAYLRSCSMHTNLIGRVKHKLGKSCVNVKSSSLQGV